MADFETEFGAHFDSVAPAPKADTFDTGFGAYFDAKTQEDGRLRASVSVASQTSPDKAAQQQYLAKATGLPLPVVQTNEGEAKARAKFQEISQQAQSSPVLKAKLLDPNFAAVAQDDVGTLAKVGTAMEFLGRNTVSGFADMGAVLIKLLDEVAPGSLTERDAATLFKNDPAALERARAESGAMLLSRTANRAQQASNDFLANMSPEAQKAYGQLEYLTGDASKSALLSPVKIGGDAIRSLPTMAAMALSIFFTKGAASRAEAAALAEGVAPELARQTAVASAAKTMANVGAVSEGLVGYAQQSLQTYQDAQKTTQEQLDKSPAYQQLLLNGYTPETARAQLIADASQQAGIIGGFVDAITNQVGGRYLGKILTEGGTLLPRVLKGFGNEAITEAVQSAGEQLGQNASTRELLNPGQDIWEGVAESAAQGFIVGGFTGGAFAGALGHANEVSKVQEDAERATGSADGLGQLMALAAQAKMREHSPQAFADVAQEMADKTDGAPTEVRFDARTLGEVLNQDELNSLPGVAAQMQEAMATGGEVSIPIGQLVASVAGTPLEQKLQEHARIGSNELSQAEAKQASEQAQSFLETEAKRVIAEAVDGVQQQASAETVKNLYLKQMNDLGRFTADVNEANATVLANVYAALAARLGVTPEQAQAAHPLTVTGVNPAKQGEVLGQDVVATETGKRSPITGKPIFQVTDGEGQVHTTHLAATAEEAAQLIRDLPARRAEAAKAVRTLAPAPKAEKAERSNWTIQRGAVENYAEDDDFLYHVTSHANAKSIIRDGLKPGGVANFGNHYVAHSAGRVFVTERSGVNFWIERIENVMQHSSDNPSAIAVVRVPKGKVTAQLQPDTEGTRDARAPAYFSDETLKQSTTRYQDKFLAGREPSALTPEERAQYDALADQLEQGARGTFNPKTLTISLLENADLSTFHHEMAHFYLEAISRIAADPNAPAAITQDMNTLLQWFGVADVATWNSMSLNEQRDSHEKFAEHYEHYLLEGKAPSLELQPLFQRFASWMKNVYLSLSKFMGKHNTALTPEVRAVYDRMLATENQIAEAEAARRYAPLFKSAADAGMTPEAWAQYQMQAQAPTEHAMQDLQARSLRDMKWTANARSRMFKAISKDVEAKRKATEAEVTMEVASLPVYQAKAYLDAAGKPTPADREATKEWNERRAAAQERNVAQAKAEALAAPEAEGLKGLKKGQYLAAQRKTIANTAERLTLEWEKQNPKPKRTPPAGDVQIASELFGYSSPDEMLRAIADAQPLAVVVEGMTDQRLLERYGDLTTKAGIENATNEAIHNEARARFVATELTALSKANTPVGVITRAAKQFAEGLVASRKVRELRPGQHTAAETRAARSAEQALRKGDTQAAVLAKRDQMLQFYAAKYTTEAQGEVARKVAALKKIEASDNLPPEYKDQIDKLLERVDLRATPLRELDRRAALGDWLKRQEEMGLDPDIPAYLREGVQLTSYKDMTVEEFRGLYDTIKQVEHLGRLKNKLLTAKDQLDFEAVRDDIADSITDLAGDRTANTRTPTTRGGRWLQAVRNFGSAHIKAATWARVMDGGKDGGKVWEYFVRSANERGEMETVKRAEATKALTEILAPWLGRGDLGKKTFFPTINRSLTRQEVLAMALNTGNASNLQRLLGGEGWTLAQLQPVLASMPAADWNMVQQIWDHFESYRPEIAAKQRRVYGVEPDWIAPGSDVTEALGIKGGYYPVKYDPAASVRAEEHADAEGAKRQLQGAYGAATTRRSFTKARVEEVNGRPLLYNLSGLYSGVNDVLHDLAWHEWLIDSNRLLKSTAIDTAMRDHYGPAAVRQFKTWRDAIAEGDAGSQEALDSALGYLRQSVSVAGLGFNVMSALMQPLGLTQSISRVGAGWIGKGVASYIGAPVQQTREAQEKSEFMANRARTQFRDLNELRNRVQGERNALSAVRENAYFLMMQVQRMVDVPTWHGAYEKAISEGNDENRAVDLADQAVIDSQGGGETKDLSAIERGGPAQKLFTTFYSFMNTALNLAYQSGRSKGAGGRAADVLLLAVAPAVLGALLKNALTPGDSGDDKDWKTLARKLTGEQISFLMGLMVVTREFGEAGKTITGTSDHPRDYAGPAGVRMIGDTYTFAKQAAQAEFDDSFRKAAVNLLGDVAGLPSAQINRTITGARALKEGKTNNPMALLMGFQEPR